MRYIFISPHMDDAVFSAGDHILELKGKRQKVFVITVFTEFGKGPLNWYSRQYLYHSGFSKLNKFSEQREKEDFRAMKKLKVSHSRLDLIDAGFRLRKEANFLDNILAYLGVGSKFIYPTKKALFSGRISSFDEPLFKQICLKLKKIIKAGDILYGPLAIGNHADHLIIRKALSYFSNKKYYWLDQPYIDKEKGRKQLKNLQKRYKKAFTVEKKSQKKEIVSCYSSQVKCLFPEGIRLKKEAYYEEKN